MTQALNLANFANFLNSSGQLSLSTGVTGALPVANGGTGLSTLTAGYIPYGNGTSAFGSTSSLFWDSTNVRLGIGTNTPSQLLDVAGSAQLTYNGGNNYLYFIGTAAYVGRKGSTGDIWLNNAGSQNTIFGVGGNEQAKIDGNGLFYFNSNYGSSAPVYGCRAWCYWNSGGTISGSGNVSSVTVNGTGNYTVNFSTAMPSNNYCAVASTGDSGGRGVNVAKVNDGIGTISASNVNITTVNQTGSSVNNSYNYVTVFR